MGEVSKTEAIELGTNTKLLPHKTQLRIVTIDKHFPVKAHQAFEDCECYFFQANGKRYFRQAFSGMK